MRNNSNYIRNYNYTQHMTTELEQRIKECIGIILTDANKKLFEDFGLTCKECLEWLEKQWEVAYNPYKVTVKSIATMCDKYATKMNNEEDANDFLQNVKVKCKDAIEFEK